MKLLNAHKAGLTLGALYALVHLTWIAMVAVGVAKSVFDWILALHHITLAYEITPFNLTSAVLLILFTFTAGYLGGYIVALLWDRLNKSVSI